MRYSNSLCLLTEVHAGTPRNALLELACFQGEGLVGVGIEFSRDI